MSAAVAAVGAFRSDSLRRRAWRSLLRLKLALVDRRKYERVVLEHLDGLAVVVFPDVFNPKLLRSGSFLVEQLARPDLLPARARVLDLGCGSGAAGLAAARRGCAVIAVDINPSAVRCARTNALLNDLRLDVRHGDLFAPVGTERFDVVLFNPPYYRGVPRDDLDHAWRSPDLPERFAAELADHLQPEGHALLVLSSDGAADAFLSALDRNHFTREVVAERDYINEVMSVYQVRPC
jgi:release factor glutamine methyltransferase